MALIGTFTKAKDGSFTGTLQTLTLKAKLTVTVADQAKDNSPSHRVFAGTQEIGAAWAKTSKENRTYYSVKLDDPSFPAPVYATLTAAETEGEYALIWNRPGAAKHT